MKDQVDPAMAAMGSHGADPIAAGRRCDRPPQLLLVVDDCQDLRELWDCWFTMCGFKVHQAQNGLEAVLWATANPPHLILMDISMPVMDGWRAMELLKAAPETAHVPIVALTALGAWDDGAARAEAVGCDALLHKPCDPDDLLQHILEVLTRSSGRSAQPDRPEVRSR